MFDNCADRCAAAVEGPSARNLALVNSLNERVLYATFSANGPSVAEDDVVDVLLEVWLRVVHGTASAD